MLFITQDQLSAWLGRLAAERALIAPVQAQPDLLLYQPVSDSDAIVYDFTRPAISPKEFFLPATEALLTIERVRQVAAGEAEGAAQPDWQVRLSEPPPGRDQVLFGLRPCDSHALLALDALLLKDPVDAPYARRRAQTTLIGLACREMGPSCFCTGLDFTPDDCAGMDLMLYPVDGGYALAGGGPDGCLTEKGQALLAGMALADYGGPSPWHNWPQTLPAQVPPRPVWEEAFNDPYWSALADRCLSCKICSYVCPTCRCFDVRDAVIPRAAGDPQGAGYQKIERLRCWDSCMSDGYRRIAGGHNPRAATAQRLRNRFYCKFDYYPADFGPLGCVGCGRCIDLCPVNVDITEVIAEVVRR
ncbi:MAG TPA: 4Fe-4S dicluster domain-containing protein [Anaerolineae bacterium]